MIGFLVRVWYAIVAVVLWAPRRIALWLDGTEASLYDETELPPPLDVPNCRCYVSPEQVFKDEAIVTFDETEPDVGDMQRSAAALLQDDEARNLAQLHAEQRVVYGDGRADHEVGILVPSGRKGPDRELPSLYKVATEAANQIADKEREVSRLTILLEHANEKLRSVDHALNEAGAIGSHSTPSDRVHELSTRHRAAIKSYKDRDYELALVREALDYASVPREKKHRTKQRGVTQLEILTPTQRIAWLYEALLRARKHARKRARK